MTELTEKQAAYKEKIFNHLDKNAAKLEKSINRISRVLENPGPGGGHAQEDGKRLLEKRKESLARIQTLRNKEWTKENFTELVNNYK